VQVEPYFNETGSNCPSILPRQQQKELLELSVNSVKVRWGAASAFCFGGALGHWH
jgi:hypothetical protein